jgi:hypothetical protein
MIIAVHTVLSGVFKMKFISALGTPLTLGKLSLEMKQERKILIRNIK